MKKHKRFYVITGILAFVGALYFIYSAFSADNMYKLGWSILLTAVALCFVTAPHYSAYVSALFTLIWIPVSIIGIIAGIVIPGEAGTILMALSAALLGSGICCLLLSVFLSL